MPLNNKDIIARSGARAPRSSERAHALGGPEPRRLIPLVRSRQKSSKDLQFLTQGDRANLTIFSVGTSGDVV